VTRVTGFAVLVSTPPGGSLQLVALMSSLLITIVVYQVTSQVASSNPPRRLSNLHTFALIHSVCGELGMRVGGREESFSSG